MGLYLGGFIIGRIFAFEIWRAYFQEGFFLGGGVGEGGILSEFYGILRIINRSIVFNNFITENVAKKGSHS